MHCCYTVPSYLTELGTAATTGGMGEATIPSLVVVFMSLRVMVERETEKPRDDRGFGEPKSGLGLNWKLMLPKPFLKQWV